MPLELSAGALVAGRYRLDAKLGEGGMGTVWAATHTVTRKRYALKFLKGVPVGRDESRRRFLREARAASAVAHPNVVAIHDIFEADFDTPVMVMDLLEGRTLGAILREKRQLPLSEIAGLLLPAISAVGTAHEVGVVHRDLKPDNIFVSSTDRGGKEVRVLDFGIAKLTAQDDTVTGAASLTSTGALLGTPYYMSPEQGLGGDDVDHRTDVWAFGVILYEALAGARPVEGESRGQVLQRLLTIGITPIESLVSDLPAEIASLVGRMLARERADRPQDLREVLQALRPHAGVDVPDFGPPGQLRSEPAGRDLASGPVQIRKDGRAVDPHSDTSRLEPARSTDTAGPLSISVEPAVGDSPRDQQPSAAPAPAPGRVPEEAEQRRSRRVRTAIALAVLLVAVLALGGFMRASRDVAAGNKPSASNSAAAPRPTAITDHPLPTSKNPEALVAYRAALQALRDANFGVVLAQLRRAVELDPALAAAHLRLVYVAWNSPQLELARESYARAMELRATLSERDQAYLSALEPLVARQPAEKEAAIARFARLTERFPLDAELFDTMAWVDGGNNQERSRKAAARAVELDPRFANSWQMLGKTLTMLGRPEEALAALDRCIEVSPSSADCRGERATTRYGLGQCSEMESDLRQALAVSPSPTTSWYDLRAAALFALGRPDAAILENYRQKYPGLPERSRRAVETMDRAWLDLAAGRFDDAEAGAKASEKLLSGSRDGNEHYLSMRTLAFSYVETGRRRQAVEVIRRHLERRDEWFRADFQIQDDGYMLRLMRDESALSPAEYARKLEESRAQHEKGLHPWLVWLIVHGGGVERPDDARAALAARPSAALPPHWEPILNLALGSAYFLSGDSARALPLLETVRKSCAWLYEPLLHARAALLLGRALEQRGDKAGACVAHRLVLDRWENARPPSVTAREAAAHAKRLSCR